MLKNSISAMTMRRDEYQAKFGFALFIASLTMFFLASLFAYGIIRAASEVTTFSLDAFPPSLLVSTLSMFGVSFAMHRAVLSVHRERQRPFLRWLWLAFALAVAFAAFQSLGLHSLLSLHAIGGARKLFGLAYFLILVHALHVVGGMILLANVLFRGRRGGYDHEKHWGVDICAMYWHFLDVVWLLMLGTFLLTR